MKKISCALLLLAITTYTVKAQFYARAGLGYAMPLAGQTMYETPVPYNGFPSSYSGTRSNTASGYTYNIKGISFSSGVQGDLGLGYMFSDHLGIEMDAAIGLSPKKYTFKDNNATLQLTGGGTLLSNITTVQQAKTPTFIMPALVLQTGGDKINIYSRFGIALPLNTKVKQDIIVSNAPGTGAMHTDDFAWEIKSSFSIGFTAAAGLKYKITEQLSIWGEVSLLSISAYAKEQNLKSWTEDGQSVPVTTYPAAQNIKFSKTAVVDSSLSSLPTYSQPFSNFGINVGVSFNLSEKRKKGENHFSSDEGVEDKKPFKRR